ncbi:hypothetical protein DNTS_015141, partial [Danionella cerebrum]
SVRGARVLITGASLGIGEQVAYHFSRFGGQIMITTGRSKALKRVVQKCEKLGAKKAMYVTGDMSDAADPERFKTVLGSRVAGGLDFLVLNHVGNRDVALWKGDADHVRDIMQGRLIIVNYVSYVQMMLNVPALERSAGSIVVVSSLA